MNISLSVLTPYTCYSGKHALLRMFTLSSPKSCSRRVHLPFSVLLVASTAWVFPEATTASRTRNQGKVNHTPLDLKMATVLSPAGSTDFEPILIYVSISYVCIYIHIYITILAKMMVSLWHGLAISEAVGAILLELGTHCLILCEDYFNQRLERWLLKPVTCSS